MPRRSAWIPALALVIACAPPSQETSPVGEERPNVPEPEPAVERLDPALDALIPSAASIDVLAEGFEWSEGPVWIAEAGLLLFSDVPRNRIERWSPQAGHALWLAPSGATGAFPDASGEGSNGLLRAPDGSLVLCQHGDRRIARWSGDWAAPDASFETLADRFAGQRFNSPNDAAFHSSGALYFTDPPYGLPGGESSETRELPFQGVYRLAPDGSVTLLTDELSRPNGIAFSPDEATLYVANSDPQRAIWMAYEMTPEGGITNGRVLFDATAMVGEVNPGLPDGLKVDEHGNLFASGPGGILVLTPDGRHLGTIRTGQATANCAFGGPDHRSLFMTADGSLMRIELTTRGAVGGPTPGGE